MLNWRVYVYGSLMAFTMLLRPVCAHANWQYTRWGMTLEEVVTASDGAARPHAKDPKKGTDKADALATAPYEAAGFSFIARFLFSKESRTLTRVDLEVEPSRCADLVGALRNRYGAPLSEMERSELLGLITWRDTDDGNHVSLLRIGSLVAPNSCALSYRPLHGKGSGL